jgi:miniconductance mechanosensitive channel
MDINLFFNIEEWLRNLGLSAQLATFINSALSVLILLALAYVSYVLTKRIVVKTITTFAKRSKAQWDDILVEKKVFAKFAQLAPALVLYLTVGFALSNYPDLVTKIQAAILIYMLIVGLLVADSIINALYDIYNTLPIAETRPIKGYVQVVKIFLYFIIILLILSIVFGKDVGHFLTGLGAMAAVLLLVFKDTILGFVASIQLSANNMVRPGDWISMPSRGADGPVTEITLNTVKVRNWDKTVSTIPTYALVSESFVNWRGMEESGGRRIKRHINIDMKSVQFCDEQMIRKFMKIHYLKDYIEQKREEIRKFNEANNVDISMLANGRRVTNLGTFRKYVEFYLKNHTKIHQELTFLIRQLQPTDKGIPLEVYVFTKEQAWANYEAVQADIFDHLIAVIPEFGLRVFQSPSGDDIQKTVERLGKRGDM